MFETRLPPEPVDALFCIAIVSELAPMLSLLHRVRLRSHRLCVGRIANYRVAVLRCGGKLELFPRLPQGWSGFWGALGCP